MRRLIFVLGMGRSGTSAITRVLSFCGCTLPRRLLGANESNPTGHWEPLDGLNLNEGFLERYGSNWYDPRLPELGRIALDSREGQAFIDRIERFLDDQVSGPVLLIKEPRITALTEFWFAAARRQEYAIAAVVAVRHPAEVAASLAARDGVPKELSNTLWLKYNWLAEQRSREIPRVFVEFPNLLADWRGEVGRIARSLEIDFASTQDQEIEAFLSPDLRRQRASMGSEYPPTYTQRVHALLSTASRDGDFSEPEIESLVVAHMMSDQAKRAIEQFNEQFLPKDLQQRSVSSKNDFEA
jgi:hypothetical protein